MKWKGEMKEKDKQKRERRKNKRRQEGISIHKPLGVSVVTPTTVTSRQVQVLIRILNFY